MYKRILFVIALVMLLVGMIGIVSGEFTQPPSARDPDVYPRYGNWNDSFYYSVEVWFDEAIDVKLWVKDPWLDKWEDMGTRRYNDTEKWERIYWEDIKPFSKDCVGLVSEFKFTWDKTDLPEVKDGKFVTLRRPGPSIAIPMPTTTPTPPPTPVKVFKNGTVKPASGYYNYSFNYGVYVKLNKTVNITLEIFDISESRYEWKMTGENQTYNKTLGWHKLTWNNASNIFKGDCAGLASYRFYYSVDGERHKSEIFYGPELISYNETKIIERHYYGGGGGGGGHVSKSKLKKMVEDILEEEQLEEWKREIGRSEHSNKPEITCNVTPEIGRWFKTFKYNATIKHPDRVNMTLALYVYKPGIDDFRLVKWRDYKSNVVIRNSSYNDKNITYVAWESKEIFDEKDVNRNGSYLFSIEDAGLEDDLNKNVVSERLKDEFKTSGFSLSKDVNIMKKREGKWVITDKEEGKVYIARKEEGKLNIYNSSDYKYFIWYYDGCYEYDPEKEGYFFDEPENVTENHEPGVTGSVTPESETFLTTFEYAAYISDIDGDDTVIISLYVKDPSDRTVLIGEKTVKIKDGKGNATWVVPSDEYPKKIFTAENLENKSFNSSFYFEYSDEGMEIRGEGKITSDPLPGPDVKPADVRFINASVYPPRGKYSDTFKYTAEFYSSEDNMITATLRIFDPSNPSKCEDYETKKESGKRYIRIDWEFNPDIFGPDDFNKTSNYTIRWHDNLSYTQWKEEKIRIGPNITMAIPILWDSSYSPMAASLLVIAIPALITLTVIGRRRRE